jgi:hypothetical protein
VILFDTSVIIDARDAESPCRVAGGAVWPPAAVPLLSLSSPVQLHGYG